MALSLVNGTRRDGFGLYGQPGVSKSGQAQLGFERLLYIGRAMDLHAVARNIGAHPGQSLPVLFTDPQTGQQFKEPKEWTIGMALGFMRMLIDSYNNDENARAFFDQYDALLIDDASIIFQLVMEIIREDIKNQGVAHPLSTQSGKPDTRRIFGAVGTELTRLLALGGKLPMSFIVVAHERSACTNSAGDPVPGAPHMPTKNMGPQILSLFSSFYRVSRNHDWLDPWATANAPYGCSFFARDMDLDWASRCRSGIVQGHGPADLWSVLELAGIRHRRAKGREFLDDWVLTAANDALSICGTGSSFDASPDARMALARKLTEKGLPSQVPADAPSSVPRDWRVTRLVYQQAFGYAYYSQRQSRDPLEMSLPDASAFVATPSGGPKKKGLTLPPPVKK